MSQPRKALWLPFTAIAVIGLLLLAACGDDDDLSDDVPDGQPTEAADNGADEPTEASGPDNGGRETVGTITVGDETWSIVPTIQCGNFYDAAGQVYISGVAAEDETVEITIDYDDSLNNAKVEQGDQAEDLNWSANESTGLVFEFDGDTVRGSGTFRHFITGDEAEGSFEVTC